MIDPQNINPKIQKPPVWLQLRWNLTATFVLLAVLPITLVVFFTLTRLSEQVELQFTDHLEGIATLKQDQIARWLEDSGHILNVLLADADKKQLLTRLTATTSPSASSVIEVSLNKANLLLTETVKVQTLFDEFFVYNAQGRVVAASDPKQIGKIVKRCPYFASSLAQNFIQPPYYKKSIIGLKIICKSSPACSIYKLTQSRMCKCIAYSKRVSTA